MATRLSPLLRAASNFGNPSDVVDATYTTIGTPTIHAIENSGTNPITFTHFLVGIHYQDVSTATGETMGEFRLRLTWGAGTATVVLTETDDLTHTGENHSGAIWVSALSFANNGEFGTGGSQSLTVEVYMDATTGTGLNWRGVYATIEYQYTYDNSESNRMQHVSWVLESGTGNLTTTANTAFGTIPQWTGSGGLLEGYGGGVSIKQVWAEVFGNVCNNGGTTDCTINYSYDGSGSNALPTRVCTLASDTFQTYLIDLSSLSTTATHTIDLWSSLASRWANLGVIIRCTFSYATADVTSQLVQMEIPITDLQAYIIGNSTAEANRTLIRFLIPEANPVMKNGGAMITYSTPAALTTNVRFGSQASYRGYQASASVTAGQFSFCHRVDSGSGSGSAITLARGKNDLTWDLYKTAGGGAVGVTGLLYILYSHDELSDQDSSSRSIRKNIRSIDFLPLASSETTISGVALSELPSGYWLDNVGILSRMFMSGGATHNYSWEINSGEHNGDGWHVPFSWYHGGDAELSYNDFFVNCSRYFKRHTGDQDSFRMDAEASRRIRLHGAMRVSVDWVGVFHTQTTTLSGTIYGSGGGTVYIYIHDADTDEILYTLTRSGNGVFSQSVHNPADNYYVTAYESDSYKGRSKEDAAGSGFDIVLKCGIAVSYG